MKFVEPTVCLIGETKIIPEGFFKMLEVLGVPTWKSDGGSDTEVIMEAAGKLCYMSFDTSLNQNLTKTGTKDNFSYLQDSIIATKHGCYDSDTDVLTSEGWKSWPDVTQEDFLATRTSAGVLEYHRPVQLIAKPYKGRMYRVDARGVDLLVTDNHNMLVCKTTTAAGRKKESFDLVTAEVLGHVSHAYVKTADWPMKETAHSDELFSLLGFAIGDGNTHDGDKAGVSFSLKKERKILFLRGLCKSLGWEVSAKKDNKFRVSIPAKMQSLFAQMYDIDREKVIPPGVMMTCSKGQLEALLLGLMQSDGHHGKTGDSYDTTSPTLVGQIQQLCLHVGIAANVCYTRSAEQRQSSFGNKPLTRLSIIRRELEPEVNKFVDGIGRTSWVDDWEGMVYCAEVPNHTLYVRRNGIPVWCGNSVLEHCVVNIAFLNVSRVLTHELVRHRAGAAYSQTSGRYVRTDELSFFLPTVFKENIELAEIYDQAISMQEESIKRMAKAARIDGMTSKEDFAKKKQLTSAFRRIVGNGVANNIIASYNHRALRNIIELRTSRHAEEEIRLVFNSVAEQVSDRYPAVYADMKREKIDGLWEVTFASSKV